MRFTDPMGRCINLFGGDHFCDRVWNELKDYVAAELQAVGDQHTSIELAINYWSGGDVTELKEYIRVSEEKPWSVEQFARAALLFISFNPMGRPTKGAGNFNNRIIQSADDVVFNQSSIDKAFGKHRTDFGNYPDGKSASVNLFKNDVKNLIETGTGKKRHLLRESRYSYLQSINSTMGFCQCGWYV
ncbi:hypothetical protein [Paenibacillus daejeonensis]|uniref:hypothetical protein n=1 Tax=Paenibacillus daejeonensis TaxID=135193 RepID=UPI00036FC067|nr:hypothetical protein [Paenibacillus daejeonensis]